MSEEPKRLSLKQLDERLKIVEESVVGPGPEYFDDILVAVINALYALRSQGAYKMAKMLEQKYFGGRDMREIGDRLSFSADLYSATKGNQ